MERDQFPRPIGNGDAPAQDIRQLLVVALLVVDPIEEGQGFAVTGVERQHLPQHVFHPHQIGQFDVKHRGQPE